MIGEWLASSLVCVGVTLMIWGHEWDAQAYGLPVFIIGAMVLTFGVRLAIDCGKAGRR